MKQVGLSLIILMLLVGCHNRVQFPSETPSEQKIEQTDIFLFWGLLGEANYELYEDCPEGRVYEVYAHTSIPQGLLTVVSLGIYSPRTIEITCSGKSQSEAMPPKKSTKKMRGKSQMKSKTKPSSSPKKINAFDLN